MKPIKNTLYTLFFLLAIVLIACDKEDDVTDNNKTYTMEKEELNIAYGNDALQKMDIYIPEGFNEQTPVVFYIHGGGFVAGTKEEATAQARLFMERGFVTVNLSHRLVDASGLDLTPPVHKTSPVKVNDQVADIDAAVKKYQAMSSSWGSGSAKIYMAGHSAGGTLAMLYVQGDKNKNRLVRASGNLAGLTNVTLPEELYDNPPTSEPLWPALKELLYRMSGAEVTKENALALMAISADWVSVNQGGRPNITVMPTSNDDDLHLAPYKNTVADAKDYDKQLRSKGVASSYVPMETDHGFGNHPDDWRLAVKYVTDFFRKN